MGNSPTFYSRINIENKKVTTKYIDTHALSPIIIIYQQVRAHESILNTHAILMRNPSA